MTSEHAGRGNVSGGRVLVFPVLPVARRRGLSVLVTVCT